jgi:folylpolyglutamate synthase/dihydropteroate synthase
MKSKLYFALPLEAYEDNHTLQIHGSHQRDNAALAIAIVQIFLQKRAMGKSWYPAEVLKPFSLPQLMRISLETTWNAGRSHIIPWRISEELSITCYLDGAHNSSTVASCIHWFADNLFHGPQPLNVREVLCVLLFTVTNLKDPFPIFQAITTTKPGGGQLFDEVIFSTSNKRDTPLSEVQEQELDAMRTSWQTLYTQPRPHVVA